MDWMEIKKSKKEINFLLYNNLCFKQNKMVHVVVVVQGCAWQP